MSKNYNLERILLVCGIQNSGKSKLIRATARELASHRRISDYGPIPIIDLLDDRCLIVRVASPNERRLDHDEFHREIKGNIERARLMEKDSGGTAFSSFNLMSAIQPRSSKTQHLVDIVAVCKGLILEFRPERIQVAVLHPGQDGGLHGSLSDTERGELKKVRSIEVNTLDARRGRNEAVNIQSLIEFFDFP